MIDTDRLQQVVRDSIERLCKELFPHGVREGNEWKIADVSGAKGDSLGICLSREKAGLFHDHATGDKGTFTELVMANRNLSFPDAAEVIGKYLAINLQAEHAGTNSDIRFDWKSLEPLSSSDQTRLAKWRGFTPEAVKRFAENEALRIFTRNGIRYWAFPVVVDSKVKGCHYRAINPAGNEEINWGFWPTKKQGGPGNQLFIIGDEKAPTTAHLTESTWDALSLCDKLGIDQVDAACVFCTRGSSSSELVRKLPSSVAEFFVWPQNDGPGQEWLRGVSGTLGMPMCVVSTPPEHKDINDWLRAGANADDLLAAMKTAKVVEPELGSNGDHSKTASTAAEENSLSEAALVARLAPKLPPVMVWNKKWYAYHDGFWQEQPREIHRPAALELIDEKHRTARRAREVLDHFEGLHQIESDLFRGAYCFDNEDILLCATNGIVRVRASGECTREEHSKDFHFNARLPAQYDPNALAPVFSRILTEALPDPLDRELYLLWCASGLIPNNTLECALCCYGPTGTSKSTLAEGIDATFGPDAMQFLTLNEICSTKGYHLPALRYAMLNIATEIDTVVLDDSTNFKRLVSGESIPAREIYGYPFTLTVTTKFLFLTNSIPRFKYGTDAELRRIRFLRFNKKPGVIDTTLKRQIRKERDGIFLILLQYLPEAMGLSELPFGGEGSQKTRERFRKTNDPLGSFVEEYFIFDSTAHALKLDVENRYQQYYSDLGLPEVLSGFFFKQLYDRYPNLKASRPKIGGSRTQVINGIRLKDG
jgi:putative DNA primase/helicase